MTKNKIKKHLYIFTNGEKTEPEYFRFCRDISKNNGQYQVIIKKTIKGNIVNLVKTVLKELKNLRNYNKEDGDEIWLVFDIDDELKNNAVKDIIKLAEEKKAKTCLVKCVF